MSYDEKLDLNTQNILNQHAPITAMKMFGGVGYLYQGNMICGINKQGLILRLGIEQATTALEQPFAHPFTPAGRPMKGWVVLHPSAIQDEKTLEQWLLKALQFGKTLPPK